MSEDVARGDRGGRGRGWRRGLTAKKNDEIRQEGNAERAESVAATPRATPPTVSVVDKVPTPAKTITVEDIEVALAERSFIDFLKFVKVMEPPPGRGVIPMEVWPHIREVCEVLEKERLLVWLKARQIGASWLLAAYALWMALFHTGARVAMLSQGEMEAIDFLKKAKFIHDQLPQRMRRHAAPSTQTEFGFPEMNSTVVALPSTEKAGRSSTNSVVILDEADYHPYIEANYNAIKPTLDDTGGQLILVSTANYKQMDSLFKATFLNAPANGFQRLFFPWNVRPGRTQTWYECKRLEYRDPFMFAKEYPDSAEEALAPPSTLAMFNIEVLKQMREDCKAPIITSGPVHVYQKYMAGKKYIAATDTSHGVGGDDAVTAVMDVTTGYVVADIQSPLIPPEELAELSVALLAQYHDPLWAIEDNDWGGVTLKKAKELGYKHLYHRAEGKPGWHTNDRTRYVLWNELCEALNSRLITIPNKAGLDQFFTVIRNPKKEGRIEAQQGCHDDYPMTIGIMWQLRKEARAYTASSDKAKGLPTRTSAYNWTGRRMT